MRVKDNGRGIEADVLRHLFEPYFQGTGSEQAMPRGLGLGLALAKAITERHGGAVTVHSDGRDLGSEFSVRLPLAAHVTVATPAVDSNRRRCT
ncbi:sensor histidine kinase [Caldimonas mangrovi]|uniref:sensor histidine kinase n=1 Tax=Caldimonas mangrovi TaxID=2944811 RepID=UPI0034A58120